MASSYQHIGGGVPVTVVIMGVSVALVLLASIMTTTVVPGAAADAVVDAGGASAAPAAAGGDDDTAAPTATGTDNNKNENEASEATTTSSGGGGGGAGDGESRTATTTTRTENGESNTADGGASSSSGGGGGGGGGGRGGTGKWATTGMWLGSGQPAAVDLDNPANSSKRMPEFIAQIENELKRFYHKRGESSEGDEDTQVKLRDVRFQYIKYYDGHDVLKSSYYGEGGYVQYELVFALYVFATAETFPSAASNLQPHCHNITLFVDHRVVGHVSTHTWYPGTCSDENSFPESKGNDLCQGDSCSNTAADSSEAGCVKLLLYNIWNYSPPWENRLHMLVEEIAFNNPDVIAFQELRYSTWEGEQRMYQNTQYGRLQITHFVDLLEDKLGFRYQYSFQPAMLYLHRIYTEGTYDIEGVGILSKFPLSAIQYKLLQKNIWEPTDEHQRVCHATTIQTPHGPFTVLNTHLSLSDYSRYRNVAEIWEFSQQLPLPQLLCGDFNSEPTGNALKFLTGREALPEEITPTAATLPDFKDSWEITHPPTQSCTDDGCQYTSDPGLTFNRAGNLTKRIDFLLTRGRITPKEVQVAGDASLSTTNTEGKPVPPSDHMPLLTTLCL
ncbi:Inositol phosphophingolipids phosphoLipase C [Pelomyxa schiedti]|nr:Inositol phosphophingolipids phosphoLipase C [Pelomyxa schiedti]